MASSAVRCSTPYGIRGLAPHGSITLGNLDPARAQRLTASEVWHTASGDQAKQPLLVLNALRHQRFGTAGAALCVCTQRRAQRLTASEVWHVGLAGCQPGYGCAQRLTASEVWHSRGLLGLCLFIACSTPYGIRGLALTDLFGCLFAVCVLNALRHQRFGTGRRLQRAAAQKGCSTPYGIRGLARVLLPCWGGMVTCSTPYGIRGLAPPAPSPPAHPHWTVLNALRHQRFGTTQANSSCPKASGAQRLTASEVWHLPKGKTMDTRIKCSTPYGIRGLAPFW